VTGEETDFVKLPRRVYDKVMAYIDMLELEIADIKKKLKES